LGIYISETLPMLEVASPTEAFIQLSISLRIWVSFSWVLFWRWTQNQIHNLSVDFIVALVDLFYCRTIWTKLPFQKSERTRLCKVQSVFWIDFSLCYYQPRLTLMRSLIWPILI